MNSREIGWRMLLISTLQCTLALILLLFPDVYSLINYMSFALWLVVGASVAGLLVLRWKQPDLKRPIKVPLVLPVVFLACCTFLVIVPAVTRPWETGIQLSFSLSIYSYTNRIPFIWQLNSYWYDYRAVRNSNTLPTAERIQLEWRARFIECN